MISIHHVGGQRIANAILRPAVLDFIELASPTGKLPVDLEEVALTPGCALDGTALSALESQGLRVSAVAVILAGEAMLMPAADETLRAGDRVVVVGERDDLGRFAALAQAQA